MVRVESISVLSNKVNDWWLWNDEGHRDWESTAGDRRSRRDVVEHWTSAGQTVMMIMMMMMMMMIMIFVCLNVEINKMIMDGHVRRKR